MKAYALLNESQISINVTNVISNSCLKNLIAGHISGNHVQCMDYMQHLCWWRYKNSYFILSAWQQHYISGNYNIFINNNHTNSICRRKIYDFVHSIGGAWWKDRIFPSCGQHFEQLHQVKKNYRGSPLFSLILRQLLEVFILTLGLYQLLILLVASSGVKNQ